MRIHSLIVAGSLSAALLTGWMMAAPQDKAAADPAEKEVVKTVKICIKDKKDGKPLDIQAGSKRVTVTMKDGKPVVEIDGKEVGLTEGVSTITVSNGKDGEEGKTHTAIMTIKSKGDDAKDEEVQGEDTKAETLMLIQKGDKDMKSIEFYSTDGYIQLTGPDGNTEKVFVGDIPEGQSRSIQVGQKFIHITRKGDHYTFEMDSKN